MTRSPSRFSRISALFLIPLFLAMSAWAQDSKTFSKEQLDQMMAPIALYPDSLLSQVLMASTYPAEVAEAVTWSKANSKQTGDAAVKAVESKKWDPSVQSLVAFPQVLAMMGEKPDWVQTLGDAFLAQPEAVMDSAQRLRAAAQKAGNLKSTEQQKIIEEPAPQGQQQTIIKIEPANPQVVYVPTYNPTVVYGPWWYPAYPPYYWPVPGYPYGSALARGIAFGAGIAISNALWGGFNWNNRSVNVNVNRYNNINVNNRINANQNNVNWKHNAENRRGVPYRDGKSREQYGKQVGGADKRQEYRGKDASRDASRQQAQAAMQQRGVDPARERQQLQNNPQARDRAQAAARNTDMSGARASAQNADRNRANQAAQNRSRDNALRGAGNGAQARQQVDRGAASRQSMAQHGGGGARAGGGGGAHAGGGARGGGGGARGGGGGGRRR